VKGDSDYNLFVIREFGVQIYKELIVSFNPLWR